MKFRVQKTIIERVQIRSEWSEPQAVKEEGFG
jgi:hypothetical protein